jgi:hypothetical protein
VSNADPANLDVSTLAADDLRALRRVFQHPLSHNLAWREVLALVKTLGTVRHARNGDVVLKIGTEERSFSPRQDKHLSVEALLALRHFLTRLGLAEAAAAGGVAVSATDVAIIIDHAGARVFLAAADAVAMPQELHHVLHHTDRARRDADRAETWPVDTRFFDEVAAAVAGEGRIVVIGHGTGQSNEADHLMAYLATHHSAVHARVVREITTDLPHMTVPQLLALARHALHSGREAAAQFPD